ncbi:MAG: hypothetical protein QOE34_1626 [Verrucomicrobiota bacterium]
MKSNNYSYQKTTVQNRFVGEPNKDGSLSSVPSTNAPSCFRKRKIFVFRKTSFLPATKGPGKQIRRILIFDDHPASLRLVMGTPVIRRSRRAKRNRTSQLIFPGVALIAALIVTFSLLL